MTEAFRYPTTIVEQIYKPAMAQGLVDICVPLRDAKPGDILAVVEDLRYGHDTITRDPINEFIVMSDHPGLPCDKPVAFRNLREDLKPSVALAVMKMQEDWNPFATGVFHGTCSTWQEERDDVYSHIYMMANVALITKQEYISEVFDGKYYDDDREQSHIDDAMHIAVIGGTSSHSLVHAQREIEDACAIFDVITPIYDCNETLIKLPVPVLSTLPVYYVKT